MREQNGPARKCEVSKYVTWCSMPSEPVRLDQGERKCEATQRRDRYSIGHASAMHRRTAREKRCEYCQ